MFPTFFSRFSALAERFPQRHAIESRGTQTLTYAALQQWAAQLGPVLRAEGVGPDVLVGIALDRSAEFIAAELGIWWAGGAFVPLDVRWPQERFEFIVRDAQLTIAIATGERAERLRALGVHVVDPHAMTANVCEANAATADQLAYVIYTSGSTGRPKGVLVEHRGIVNLLDEQIKAFQLDESSRSLWMLSPAFDASVSDIGTALLSGTTLVIERDELMRDPAQLTRLLNERRITYIDLPPVFLPLFDREAMPDSLKTICIGGEPAAVDVVRHWAEKYRVVNVYGPTEATVCTSLGLCAVDWEEPLLGQPIRGVEYRVEDNLTPQPPLRSGEGEQEREACGFSVFGFVPPSAVSERGVRGVRSGELLIGGSSLARGYLNQPELTASKFIVLEGQRFYRTGDRVRLRDDGEYVFLGRMDRQFKLRGQLIEPEEVEQRLCEHPAVSSAALVKRLLHEREALVAFVVVTEAIESGQLRGHLQVSVPRWMVPHHIEIVSSLPRTTNGKVDFAALTSVSLTFRREVDDEVVDAIEAKLQRIWEQVLRCPIDPKLGFMAHGGDSLQVLHCVAHAYTHGLMIPPSLLAEDRSLRDIADWLRQEHLTPVDVKSADDLTRDVSQLLQQCSLPATQRGPSQHPAQTILVTGATGFLGSWTLRELLRQTRAKIVCLVRAANAEDGYRRLGLNEEFRDRVVVVCGDIAQPYLGIAATEWRTLTHEIDSVYHIGALVNMVSRYEALREANVVSACEVLQFLAVGKPKRLHYASTLSVFVATDRNTGVCLENDDLSATREVYGGYAQSKWTAECLLRQAQGAFGEVVHYRFGLITGDQETGQGSKTDFLGMFIRGLRQIGGLPKDVDMNVAVDITPIDYAATAFVHLSLHAQLRDGATFHLANKQGATLAQFLQAFADVGIELDALEEKEWWQRLEQLREREPTAAAACLGLCRVLPTTFAHWRTMDLFQATNIRFDTTNTDVGLRGSGITCLEVSIELLKKYVWAALKE